VARRKRQEAEIEQSRTLILESAARIFAEKGFQASSMAAIAKEAGYTAPTLYTYFKAKADIYFELVDLVVSSISNVYQEHEPPGMSFAQRLELLLLRQFKVIDEQSDTFAFFLTLSARGEAGPVDVRDRDRHTTEALSLRQQMTNWLDKNLQGSEFADLPTDLVEIYIQGVTLGFASRWAEGDRKEPMAKSISVVVTLLIGGLEGLLKQRSGEAAS
tara:strand:- start:78186 stop:78833 length:648 start_codon:yes stop_codon:yes gene_type:complete